VYSLKALLAAAYKFTDRWTVLVDTDGDDHWGVFVAGPDGTQLDSMAAAFANELADQQLRALLEAEFGALRTLVVAQAFSEGNLLDPDRGTSDDKADARGTGLRR
jgi:His-Xaa-Ser system protein HxsD